MPLNPFKLASKRDYYTMHLLPLNKKLLKLQTLLLKALPPRQDLLGISVEELVPRFVCKFT